MPNGEYTYQERQIGEIGRAIAEMSDTLRDLVEIGKRSHQAVELLASNGAQCIVDTTTRVQALEKFRQDTLCWSGHLKSQLDAIESSLRATEGLVKDHDAGIEAIVERLEANEQAVQSCLSTLGELNKVVHALAARATGLPGIPG